MAEKQQMRWTPEGAHLLLQIRTRVLNGDLADDFHRWYRNFTHQDSGLPYQHPEPCPGATTPWRVRCDVCGDERL